MNLNITAEQRQKIIDFFEAVLKQTISTSYNNDIDSFYAKFPTAFSFVSASSDVITNPQLRQAITVVIDNQEYGRILNSLKGQNNSAIQNVSVSEVNSDSGIQYTQLTDVPRAMLPKEEQAYYDRAIHYAMKYGSNHNIEIGVKNNHIVPMIREDGVEKPLDMTVEEEQNTINASRGFSDGLILAFIIGSVIGIIFLNIYSRFMK